MSNNINRRRFLTRAGLDGGRRGCRPRACFPRAAAARAARGERDTFKVGAVLELSGASATGGQIAQRGYQLWADTVNKVGRAVHRRHEVQGRADRAGLQERSRHRRRRDVRLVTEEGVNAIFGAYTSGVQLAMDPICAEVQGAVHRRLRGVSRRLAEAARVHLRRHPRRRHHSGPLDPVDRGHRESQAGHGGGRRRQRAVLRRHRRGLPRGCRGREARM